MESYGAGRRPDALIAFACAAALVALAAWLGRLDLLDPDEGRHAEIAREMLAGGRWLTPVLHGRPYYDKPAAFYWLLGASMSAFGLEAWAARLPSVLAALWTILVTARFARRTYGVETGALAAIGLATTLGFVALGRTVLVDMSFTAALTTALCSLGIWYVEREQRRRSILPFYLSIGIACLLKGPAAAAIGVLAAVGVLVAARDVRLVRELQPVKGALIVFAVALPWYAAAWLADPDYIRAFVLHHNVQRYLQPISTGHDEPWYYYLVALPAALLPWTPVVFVAAFSRLRRGRRTCADVFCAIWAGSVLALFLPAGTKLLTYLLPAFPPFVVLGAAWVTSDAAGQPATRRWFAPYAFTWTSFVAFAAPAAAAFAALHGEHSIPKLLLSLLPAAVLATALRHRHAADIRPLCAAIAGSALALTVVVFALVSGTVNELRGVRRAAEIVRVATDTANGEFVAYRCTPNAVAFYAQRVALRTVDARVAAQHFFGKRGAVLMMERKRLAELGLDPPPAGVSIVWRNVNGLVLLVRHRLDGGEGRESNPPPTFEAGVTVLKTGRTTGPDPSPYARVEN